MAATQIITIPDDKTRHGYIVDITTPLDAGADVLFNDSAGNEVNCSYIDGAADATISSRVRNAADSTAATQYLVKGGWHNVMAAKIFTVGHTASATLRARFD